MRAHQIGVLQFIDLEKAVSLFLDELKLPMSELSLDYVAAGHWEFRPLLTHPRVKALIVQQGKWTPYLADRVPDYAAFKAKK